MMKSRELALCHSGKATASRMYVYGSDGASHRHKINDMRGRGTAYTELKAAY